MSPMDWEMCGFDDATEFLVDPAPDTAEKWKKYYNPPEGDVNCVGCTSKYVCAHDATCLRCRYNLGHTEGMSK